MTRITTNGPDHYDPRPMTSWQRDHRDGPLQATAEHKPFWRYIFAVVLFLAVVIVVGNLIEVML